MDPDPSIIEAAAANARVYGSLTRADYIEGAPHLLHRDVRILHDQLVTQAFEEVKQHCAVPRVLDLGAGEGSVTAIYLGLGAKVTAVEISPERLNQLKEQCAREPGELEVVCSEVFAAVGRLAQEGREYDLVVANAFLHHVPSYEELLRRAVRLLAPHGLVLTFADPLRYDSLRWPSRLFDGAAYFSWRLSQGDVTRGAQRFVRRRFGNFTQTPEDNVDYHAVRNGVDQDALERLLTGLGMECRVVRYFSTQSPFWQAIGKRFGMVNSFGILASRKESFQGL